MNFKLPQFSATYHFQVNPENDFKADAKEQAEQLTTEPLMRAFSDSDLYKPTHEDELGLALLNDTTENTYHVSAFLNADNQLVVNTPESNDSNPAKESAMIKKLLSEAGLVQEKINDVVRQVLNGGSAKPAKEKQAIKKASLSPEVLSDQSAVSSSEFDIIRPSQVIPQKILNESGGYLRDILIKHIEADTSEEGILNILSAHPKVTELSEGCRYLVMEAASKKGFLKTIHYFRRLNSPIDNPGYSVTIKNIQTAAVENGQLNVLQYLLNQGYTLDATSLNGPSLLRTAVKEDQPEAVEFLIENGVDPLAQDPNNSFNLTLVGQAIEAKSLPMLKLLHEEYNLPLRYSDDDPDGAYLACRITDNPDLELFKYVFEKVKDTADFEQFDRNPARWAASRNLLDIFDHIYNTQKSLVTELNSSGENAIHAAARNASKNIVIEYATTAGRDNNGNTLAHLLVRPATSDYSSHQEKKNACEALRYLYQHTNQFHYENNDGKLVWDMMDKMFGKEKALKKLIGVW